MEKVGYNLRLHPPMSSPIDGAGAAAGKALDDKHYKDKSLNLESRISTVWSVRYILGITLIWTIVVHYFERTYVSNVLGRCHWSSWERENPETELHHILLVADPQIVDDYSYPKQPKLLGFFVKQLTDNYLRRNYQLSHSVFRPNTTIFLGDLFDGGREWDDDKWLAEYNRYRRVFSTVDHYYSDLLPHATYDSIPGNHDIGFESINKTVQNRFSQHFGPSNRVVDIHGHHIVMVDTISYSHPDSEISRESHEFVKELPKKLNDSWPRIMMSHVPLYRDPNEKPCGPDREKPGKFPLMKGLQYQTVIEHKFTHEILTAVRPVAVFAGDDHDYCDITQEYESNGSIYACREVAVKSSAMSSGIRHPALQLLTLYKPTGNDLASHSFDTKMCYMPDPFATIKACAVVYAILLAILVILERRKRTRLPRKDVQCIIIRMAQAFLSLMLVLGWFFRSI